jgi:hypothetical protein
MSNKPASIMRRFALISLLSASIFVLPVLSSDQVARAADVVRVTTSFDVKYASAVLRQVAHLFNAGFGKPEADHVARDIDALKPDQPRDWQFTVQYKDKSLPLQIRALLDDMGMIDLDFATAPEAAPALRSAVDSYLNSRSR